jgi:hypothetical protein
MSPSDSAALHGSRRALLTTLAAAGVGSLAGCLDDRDRSADRDGPPPSEADTGTVADGTDDTDASSPARLELTHTDPTAVDGPVVVYPPELRTWLRDAATGEEPIRVHGSAPVDAPMPILTSLPAVELPATVGADDGGDGEPQTYAVRGEGGTRYDILVGAEAVESVPGDADPTPVGDLSGRRRDLVRRAISEQSRATVVPETRLGEWVRTEYFDGYVEQDGTVYRGYEVRQTDAAFFSEEFWLVVSLVPVEASSAPTPVTRLAFPEVPQAVRSVVDPVLPESKQTESLTTATGEDDDALREFAATHDYLLTHTALFEVGKT